MKRQCATAALTLVLVLGAGAAVGCSAQKQADVNADTPTGAAQLMPGSHQGRFEVGGANECYGCHGANDKANPILKDSKALPDTHYVDESSDSQQVNPLYQQCNTCHAQG